MRWVMYTSTDGTSGAGLVMDGKIHGLGAGTRVIDLLGDDGEAMDAAAERRARTRPR